LKKKLAVLLVTLILVSSIGCIFVPKAIDYADTTVSECYADGATCFATGTDTDFATGTDTDCGEDTDTGSFDIFGAISTVLDMLIDFFMMILSIFGI